MKEDSNTGVPFVGEWKGEGNGGFVGSREIDGGERTLEG